MAFVWDDAAISVLKREWPKGTRAGEIAEMIGAGSKSAVIGKAHRIGLNPHADARKGAAAWPRRQKVRFVGAAVRTAGNIPGWIAKRVDPPEPAQPPRPRSDLPPLVARVTFDELEANHCRWPVGDPRQPGFGFFGQPRAPGASYCPDCCERARAPRETRSQASVTAVPTQSHAPETATGPQRLLSEAPLRG